MSAWGACPECRQGKHLNCTSTVLATDDTWKNCPCKTAGHSYVEVAEVGRTLPARSTDPATSHAAAADLPRAGTQRARMLQAYGSAEDGWTDEEAAQWAVLTHTGYWKRCSDLRDGGYIEPIEGETRLTTAGKQGMVCRITDKGREALRKIEEQR